MDGFIDIAAEIREAEEVRDVLDVNNIRRKRYRRRIDPFVEYDDKDFRSFYRVEKNTARFIVNLIRAQSPIHNTQRGLPVSTEIQVLATLRYFAKGSYQDEVAEVHGMSQSTLSRIVKRVVTALARHREEFIKFPTEPEEISALKQDFFDIAACPSIVGAVDGTHIKVKCPGVRDPYPLTYMNRKGFYSLNVQVVCDAKCRILDIVARWRGSVHDSRIWNESRLKEKFENGEVNGILLGDSGYPASRYLLTPVLNPRTPAEERYNRAHITTRNVIERLFGIWKNKFRCFFNGLHIDLDVAKNAIIALAIIHNIYLQDKLDNDDESDDEDFEVINDEENVNQVHNNNQGNIFRRNYIARFFQ